SRSGSRCRCGLPSACTSPMLRSTLAGLSINSTASAAKNMPGAPANTRLLPARCCSIGNQPTSTEAPVHTAMSARRRAAISAGRASIWWGSCRAWVAATMLARGASTRASAAHSGSQANTVRAWAGGVAKPNASTQQASAATRRTNGPATGSEGMRTMGSEAHHVLQADRIAGVLEAAAIALGGPLQPQRREMRTHPGQHQARLPQAPAMEVVAMRLAHLQRAGPRAQLPPWREAVYRRQVPGLVDVVAAGELAQIVHPRVLARKAQLARRIVAVGRPLPDRIG